MSADDWSGVMNAMTRAALGVMLHELGALEALKLGVSIAFASLTQDPFRSLASTSERAARASRAQLKPAVLTYRCLLTRRDPQEALRLTELIIQASGRAFLRGVLRGLDIPKLLASERREELLRARLQRVPNATFSLRFEGDTLHFTVTACRFVQLCHEVGHPELAPLFCSVDDAFFGHDLKGVELNRATTIAHGGDCCPFVFSTSGAKRGELPPA